MKCDRRLFPGLVAIEEQVQDADHARAHSYLTLHTGQPGEGLPRPAEPGYLVGDFRDCFIRDKNDWKFSERLGSLALKVGG